MAKESTSAVILGQERVGWTILQGSKGRFDVTASGDEPVPEPEAPEGDVAANKAERIEGTSELVRTHLGKSTGDITLGIPTDQVLMRVLTLPTADDEDIPGMVELQIDKLSPFPIENMVVSHELLKRDDTTSTVLVAACQIANIEKKGAILNGAGVKARRVDVEIMGWWRSLLESGSVKETGTHVIVLMTGEIPTMIIVDGGVPAAFRSLKGCEGLGDADLGAELRREIEYTLMSRELVEEKMGAPAIAIWRRGEPGPQLLEAVKEASGANVTGHDLSSLMPSSHGMALRASGDGRIDLTPATWTQEREAKQFKSRMIVAAAGAFGVWLLLFGGASGYYQFEKSRLSKLDSEREKLREPATEVRLLRRRVRMVEAYLDHSQSALECLREIAKVQPDGVDLTSYFYKKGESVKIVGQGKNVDMVLTFKAELDSVELFPSGKLRGPTKTARGQVFDITLELEGEEDI